MADQILTFKFKQDYRKFKKDEEIQIPVQKFGITYIGGKNGSGKSTLLHMIRNTKDSLEEVNNHDWDGIGSTRLEQVKVKMPDVVEISGVEAYDEVFCFDSVVDDPNSSTGAGASAFSFVQNGGYQMQVISRGQSSAMLFIKFKEKVKRYLDKKYQNPEEFLKKKMLVILDEVDEGLDIAMQAKWNHILLMHFILEFGCDVICVSHNPFCILSPGMKTRIYDLDSRSVKETGDYIEDICGLRVTVEETKTKTKTKNDGDNRKEDTAAD